MGGRPLARAAVEAGLPRDAVRSVLKDEHDPSLSRAFELAAAFGLEIYIGPSRNEATISSKVSSKTNEKSPDWVEDLRSEIRGLAVETRSLAGGRGSTRQVEVRELAAAAGGGAIDLDETVRSYVAFRRNWLDRITDDPTRCTVISVTGDSMEPTLPDGCSILVDFGQHTLKEGRIYVVRLDEGLVVKRSVRVRERWQLRSDNQAYPDRPWAEDAAIIGEVKWVGRTL